jgi:transcriptional regulator with XRE-family HTH domain
VVAPDLVALGAFVRQRRLALGMTQTQLARLIGLHQENVSEVEHGKYGLPSVPLLARVAVALQARLSDVIAAAGFPDEPAGPVFINGDDRPRDSKQPARASVAEPQ